MKKFNNLKIGVRILIGFFTVIMIAAAIGTVGIQNLKQINASYESSYGDSVAALELLETVSSSFQRSRMNLYGLILAESAADKEFYLERTYSFEKTMNEGIATYQNILSAYDLDEIKDILTHLNSLTASVERYTALRENLIRTQAMDATLQTDAYHELKEGDLRSAALEVDEAISNIIAYEKEYAYSEISKNISLANVAVITMISVLGAGIVLAILIGLYIARSISKKITLLVQASDKIASGDLNIQIEADSKDEIGSLAQSFQHMTGTLKTIIHDLTRGLEAFSHGNFTLDSQAPDSYVGDFAPIAD